MPRITDPPPAPRVHVAGTTYGLTLTVPQYASLTGQSADSVYDSVKAGTTAIPPIRLSSVRIAFPTVATVKLLGLDYEIG